MEAEEALAATGVATEATVEAVPPAEAGRGEVAAQAVGTETVKWEDQVPRHETGGVRKSTG